MMKITVSNNGNPRDFYVNENYLADRRGGAVRDYLIIHAEFPSMKPCYRSDVVMAKNCMMILIDSGDRKTGGEFIVEQWNIGKNREYNGPGFDRYVGTEDGYDVYETLPFKKTGEVSKTLIFLDRNNSFVSDNRNSYARFRELVVRYGRASTYGTTPKEMHAWIEKLLDKLMSIKLEDK